jgi:orotidine-5'-phosphate decarboxylase
MTDAASFPRRLRDAVAKTSPVCVGIDPRPELLPRDVFARSTPLESLSRSEIAHGLVRFAEAVIEEARGLAGVVKPQAAFFERLLEPGFEAFIAVCRIAAQAGLLVIADVKRGDIGTTAEAYADAYLAPHGGDGPVAAAVTVNPYLGRDGIAPFVAAARSHAGGVFVLVKTSNASSADYQDRESGGRRVFEIVADDVERMSRETAGGERYGLVGAVAGGTHAADLAALRARMPSCWLLVPGYGAQGAGAGACAAAFDAEGLGAVVNASRSLNTPWDGTHAPKDWRARIRSAMLRMREELLRARDAP